jgi:hypothetical protein
MTTNVVTLTILARRFADAANKADNSAVRLSKHAEFPACVERASAPKTGKSSPIVAEAKRMLGVTDERGTKTGPKGEQKWTVYGDGVTGQHVENVATLLKKHMSNDAPKPIRLAATLSGDDVDGGTVEIERDSDLGRALLALIAASK